MQLSVFKKLNVKILTTHLSGPSALKDLTYLFSLPQWVHLEASLFYGIVLFSMVIY